jgi:hypothetical protein
MSLTASEERVLTRIEQALLSRDPCLKSLFAIFTRLTRHETMPAIEQLRRRRWQPSAGAVFLLTIALIIGVIVMGSFASPNGCGPAQPSATTAAHASASAPSASNQGCSPAFDLRR